MEMNFLHHMLLTAISLMCFSYFLYNNSMQLSILIIEAILIELLLKLGRLRHNNKTYWKYLFSVTAFIRKNILFLRKELCTELFCINFSQSTFYKLIHKVTHSSGLFLNLVSIFFNETRGLKRSSNLRNDLKKTE